MYELLYIIPTPYTETDLPAIQKGVVTAIENLGGRVIKEENLGSKKLAYPIKLVRRGFYIFVVFEIAKDKLAELNKLFILMPEVLRFQITVKPKEQIRKRRSPRPIVEIREEGESKHEIKEKKETTVLKERKEPLKLEDLDDKDLDQKIDDLLKI
ncbi:MAG: 30S ribosomal protein S6 [Patescibacteria group bacterium]